MSNSCSKFKGKRAGKHSMRFDSKPRILGAYSLGGQKEGLGPIAQYIDCIENNAKCGEKTFEKAEHKMQFEIIKNAIADSGLDIKDIDALFAGDLLNQIVTSNYTARCFDTSFIGVYGACSTSAETLLLAASMIDGGFINTAACSTVSHFATAERQYRGPLELGGQRAPYSQWTVTGGGCCVLGVADEGIAITSATMGRVLDYGVLDANNMGAAMAPAAADTIMNHFKEMNTVPDDYDLIVTGDLGKLGSDILRDLISKEDAKYKLKKNYIDCGHLMYSHKQNVNQGGSGCGCSAVALSSYIYKKMLNKEFRKVLFVATGALMSTTISQQGESIPSIAHAVVLEV